MASIGLIHGGRISYAALIAGCGILFAVGQAQAVPLSITQLQSMRFSTVIIPGGQQSVTMNGSGAITAGSQWVTGGAQQEGIYSIGGDPGLIDISVGAVNTCSPTVTAHGFSGTFGSGADPLNNIEVSPASNIQLGNGNGNLVNLGATLTFNASTPAGVCNIDFDLTVDYH